jgi:hypothetical protein
VYTDYQHRTGQHVAQNVAGNVGSVYTALGCGSGRRLQSNCATSGLQVWVYLGQSGFQIHVRSAFWIAPLMSLVPTLFKILEKPLSREFITLKISVRIKYILTNVL